MRPIEKWTESYLLQLIRTKVEESVHLDYKRSASLKQGETDELTKDVSSFANSDGGFIVYGLAEDSNKHFPERIDGGVDPNILSKEWLEQVIDSRINPRIPDYRIKAIQLTKTHPGRVVYVVWVPKSRFAPHMAADRRYYKRGNFKAQAMEHYEVLDVMNRAIGPALALGVSFNRQGRSPLKVEESPWKPRKTHEVNVRFLLRNERPQPTQYAAISVYMITGLELGVPSGFPLLSRLGRRSVLIGNTPLNCEVFQRYWGAPGDLPIWDGIEFELFPSVLDITLPLDGGAGTILYRIDAPGMQTKVGGWSLSTSNKQLNWVPLNPEVLTIGSP